MRAITVRQPYASEILSGEKKVENRNFFTQPGDILICAGKAGDGDGPRGAALCIARVIGFVYEIEGGEIVAEVPDLPDGEMVEIDGYNPGSIGWLLRNIRPVEQVPVRGMPGIFRVDDQDIKILPPG